MNTTTLDLRSRQQQYVPRAMWDFLRGVVGRKCSPSFGPALPLQHLRSRAYGMYISLRTRRAQPKREVAYINPNKLNVCSVHTEHGWSDLQKLGSDTQSCGHPKLTLQRDSESDALCHTGITRWGCVAWVCLYLHAAPVVLTHPWHPPCGSRCAGCCHWSWQASLPGLGGSPGSAQQRCHQHQRPLH
jgi:hypothetical protein